MGAQMVEYVCHALLRHVREFDHYETDDPRRTLADPRTAPPRPSFRSG